MSQSLFSGREPQKLFRFFEEITRIPRGSYNEKRIADYLVDFAYQRGLSVFRDKQNNVLIVKNATPGYAEKKTVVLQGHTDMVCEKLPEIEHDFEKDPIEMVIDGDFIKAKGTTLGGDDGVAVAMMLAILDDENLEHPDLECLFTTSEEVGLNGMSAFDARRLIGRSMINIDSTNEGEAVISCAGGCRSDFLFDLKRRNDGRLGFEVSVSGFSGGHSGENIAEGRMNANKAMARILDAVAVESKLRIVEINGGNKDNAIPRHCRSVFTSDKPQNVRAWIEAEWKLILEDCKDFDKGATMTIKELGTVPSSVTEEQTADILRSILVLPSGILELNSLNDPETSSNLGVIHTTEKQMVVTSLTRSASDGKLDRVLKTFQAVAAFASAKLENRDRYSGWELKENTPLQNTYLEVYRRMSGEEARLISIHAGLECGLMAKKIPDMDMISIGPNLYDIHSPSERLSISSFVSTYRLVCELIRSID